MVAKARRRIFVTHSLRRPFWEGIARIVDFTGTMNTPMKVLPRSVADGHAIWMDWKAVGDDLMSVMGSQRTQPTLHRRQSSAPKIDR